MQQVIIYHFKGVAMCRFLILLFLITSVISTQAQKISSYGKEFFFAIPPNDSKNSLTSLNVLKLYITAISKSKVEVTYNGVTKTYTINANSTKEISLDKESSLGATIYTQEVYETGVVKNKTFVVSSDYDISVSVLNSKEMTADSYTVFPTKAWGNNYIHLAYWDQEYIFYPGGNQSDKKTGSGMLIIANQDNTQLKILYKGKKGTKTTNGKRIGENETVTLNKGEVFSFRSTGEGELRYDLSGTQVISNKPVGAISFHQRTSIPGEIDVNGKDYLVEMVTPVTAWGKKYVCLQLNREDVDYYLSTKWGDYFRGIASENGTIVTCKYYSFETGELYDELEFKLNANEYFEYNGSKIDNYNNRSIRGISIWESNKPFMLMQYCYSSEWDKVGFKDKEYDPFMTLAVPTEQYVNYTVFNVPGLSSGIINSFANILVTAPDYDNSVLKTIKIDGQSLSSRYPQLLLNKVPNEDLYWLRFPISSGNHIIEAETTFGAYLYGFGNFISYGHTTSQGFEPINNDGAPRIEMTEVGCGEYYVSVMDSSGIQSLEFSDVNNITYDTTGFYKHINSFEYSFKLNVIDVDINCSAKIFATDVLGYTGMYTFTFPEENMKYYNLDLVSTKSLFETTDTLKVDLNISSEYWPIYPLDTFEIKIEYENNKYQFIGLDSKLEDDFSISYKKEKIRRKRELF